MVTFSNSVDSVIGASISGATNTLTVQNPSNTASSQAQVNVTVGGGTAGDAYTTYTVSGVTNWSEGVDNSDSDAYVLAASTALGTTNVIHATTGGILNYPLQPSFLATVNSSINNVTGDGTIYTVIFDTIRYDQASNFNTTTGTFTAPRTGIYLFQVGLGMNTVGAGHTYSSLALVTTGRSFALDVESPAAVRASTNDFDVCCGTFVNMTAGDTANITIQVSNSTKTINIRGDSSVGLSWFSGALIC